MPTAVTRMLPSWCIVVAALAAVFVVVAPTSRKQGQKITQAVAVADALRSACKPF